MSAAYRGFCGTAFNPFALLCVFLNLVRCNGRNRSDCFSREEVNEYSYVLIFMVDG